MFVANRYNIINYTIHIFFINNLNIMNQYEHKIVRNNLRFLIGIDSTLLSRPEDFANLPTDCFRITQYLNYLGLSVVSIL